MITSASMQASFRDRIDNNIYDLVGTGIPTVLTGAGIAGPGSTYTDVATGNLYTNYGTIALPVWISGILQSVVSISAADIVATGAGKFGHASGYPLVAAQGAKSLVELVAAVMAYDFAVAAYTGGGNITVNWSAGGAALTGLISAANSVGAAADKAIQFVPLSTVGIPMVENAGLNLVSSAAFTQPGTAAGVIKVITSYRIHSAVWA